MDDHAHARSEHTNIRVSLEGRWFTGTKEIVNDKVISHFKQSLFRDDTGIYIYQTFRQFAEKGYITVEGPLLSVFRIDAENVTFDSLDTLPMREAEVCIDEADGNPYLFFPRLQCYASIGAGVSPYFSEFLEESGDGFTFCGKPVKVKSITVWG
jgi:hypothetical protein